MYEIPLCLLSQGSPYPGTVDGKDVRIYRSCQYILVIYTVAYGEGLDRFHCIKECSRPTELSGTTRQARVDFSAPSQFTVTLNLTSPHLDLLSPHVAILDDYILVVIERGSSCHGLLATLQFTEMPGSAHRTGSRHNVQPYLLC